MDIIEAITLAFTNPLAVADEILGIDNPDVDNDEKIELTQKGQQLAEGETDE